MKNINEKQLRKDIITICKLTAQNKYVAATDGNVSAKIDDNTILITPSGVNKHFLKEEQLVKTNLLGEIIEGDLKPSSEIRMHLKIYEMREDVQAVVHAHPPMCTAFTVAGQKIDARVLPEVILTLGYIPITEYATPTTDRVPEVIEKYVENCNAIILDRHGSVTYGKDVFEAYNRLEKIEHAAQVTYYAKNIGKCNIIDDTEVNKLETLADKYGIKTNKQN